MLKIPTVVVLERFLHVNKHCPLLPDECWVFFHSASLCSVSDILALISTNVAEVNEKDNKLIILKFLVANN